MQTPPFALTDEQRLLAENLGRLLSETHSWERRRPAPKGLTTDWRRLWASLADLGLIGAAFEERLGGFAGDARTVAVVMSGLGFGLALVPYLECAVVAGRILQAVADDPVAHASIEAIIRGEETYLLACPPAATLSPTIFVSAAGQCDGVVLNGRISAIRHALSAQRFLVPAAGKDGRLEIYRVPRETAGLELQSYRLIDGSHAADLTLRDVGLRQETRLPLVGDSRAVLEDALEWGAMAGVAEAVGILAALNTATFSYLMTRKQFGTAIGTFQALQHRAVDMHIAAEEAVALADAAIESFSAGPSPGRSAMVSAAKVVADRAARRVGAEAVQLHGGMGVSDELIVSHYARRLIAIRHTFGGADTHRQRFGRIA